MTIRRRDFVSALSQRGGRIDVNRMSPRLRTALRDHGVSGQDLRTIAGRDHVIRGQEFSRLYDRVFGGDTASPAASRSGDIGRARNLYTMLRTEAAQHADDGGTGGPRSPARVGIGARRAPRPKDNAAELRRPGGERHPLHAGHNHNSGPSGSDLGIRYTAPTTPDVDPDAAAPKEPNWFMKILETLFGWLGMNTDHDRLVDHGQQLADQYGAEIDAFRAAYEAEHGGAEMSNRMPVRRDVLAREMRTDLVENVAARMRAQGVSPDTATQRAGVVVDAMLDRVDSNTDRDGRTGAAEELPAPNTPAGRKLAATAASARRSADRLEQGGHPEWSRRLDAALTPVPDDHPWVRANTPERQDQARAAAMTDRVRAVTYLMALDEAGGLDNLGADKDEFVDGLLSAQTSYDAGGRSVGAAASALNGLTAAQRTELRDALRSVPEDRRPIVYAVLAREHGSLASSEPTERAGAIERVENAASQVSTMSVDEARAASNRGTLGLDKTTLTLDYGLGRTVDVPLYFHPGISDADRRVATELVREAYGHMPYAAMQRVVAGEGDQPFNVQILPNGSFNAGGSADPKRPSNGDGAHAYYQTDDNQVRVNMSMFSQDLENDPGARSNLVTMILHETVHELDDLGNTDQDLGFFVHHQHNPARDRARTTGEGDLAPSWAHVARARSRFDDQSTDVGHSRRARRYFTLSRQSSRSPEEQTELTRLGREIAARSGTTTPYSATGGNGQRSLQMAEWWAESYSRYLNPDTRAELRAVDPVAHRAAARYSELLANGTPPDEAIRTALRFSLATDVSAAQGRAMLADADRATPLPAATLDDLDLIGQAFTDHAEALDGWTPYHNDSRLKAARRGEASNAVTSGRSLLTAIGERRTALETSGRQNSDEYTRLGALETRMQRAITALETDISALQ